MRMIKASEVQLVTIPNIPILEAGVEWQLGTGPYTPTVSDLEDAVRAANEDPTFGTPRLKIGHVDMGWQSGEPSFGQFQNLKLSADKMTIFADAVNVPLWLAEIMPSAYPSRSFEGKQGHTTNAGKSYRLVITAVSLLGVEMPGIGSLDDLHQLFTNPQVEYAEGVYKLSIAGKALKAQIDADDVKRSFYNDFATGDKYWWWIRAVRLDPNEIIVDDEDNGQLYRIPFTVNDRAVSFGDPQAVYIDYIDDTTVKQEDKAARLAASWDTAAESRPTERSNLDPKALRAAIGLPETASDDEVLEKIKAGTQPPETPPPPETTPPAEGEPGEEETPEEQPVEGEPQEQQAQGPVLVDAAALAELRSDAAMGRAAREEQITESRETFLAAAVAEGKFPPARKDHFRKLMKADEKGTKELIASLETNVVPVHLRGGADPATDMAGTAADDSYPSDWLTPAEQAIVKARRGGGNG